MPGPLHHVGAPTQCPHGGQGQTLSSNVRVKAMGQYVATSSDLTTIAGCPFAPSSNPQPCTQVQWIAPATRVKVGGQPVLLQNGAAQCVFGAVPQGPPIVSGQTRVKGV
jgi:hypothetical protein